MCALLVACAPDPAAVSSASLPIIGGAPSDDANVMGLLDRGGALICTGTLIGPRAIVAAAHCRELVDARIAFFGADTSMPGTRVDLAQAIVHPSFDPVTLADDVAVYLLDAAPPAEAGPPALVATRAPAVGESLRFVGYGWTEIRRQGDYGVRTSLATEVTEVADETFTYGVATCNGDSGGPAFLLDGEVEKVIGVTSYGDAPCAEFGVDTRLDAYATFLAAAAATTPPSCGADGLCGNACPAVDPDCPCQTDGLCVAECPDLTSDEDCPRVCGADGTCGEDCPRDPDCTPPDDGGGCGCRVGAVRGATPGGAAALALLVGLGFAARGRRRPRAWGRIDGDVRREAGGASRAARRARRPA